LAGTPLHTACRTTSVSAAVRQYGGAAHAGTRRAKLHQRLAWARQPVLRQSPPIAIGFGSGSTRAFTVAGPIRRWTKPAAPAPITIQVALPVLRPAPRGGTDASVASRPPRPLPASSSSDDPGEGGQTGRASPARPARGRVEAAQRPSWVPAFTYNTNPCRAAMPIWLVSV